MRLAWSFLLVAVLPSFALANGEFVVLRAFRTQTNTALIEIAPPSFPEQIRQWADSRRWWRRTRPAPSYPVSAGWYVGNTKSGVFRSLILAKAIERSVQVERQVTTIPFEVPPENGHGVLRLISPLDTAASLEDKLEIQLGGNFQGLISPDPSLANRLNSQYHEGSLTLKTSAPSHRVPGWTLRDDVKGEIWIVDHTTLDTESLGFGSPRIRPLNGVSVLRGWGPGFPFQEQRVKNISLNWTHGWPTVLEVLGKNQGYLNIETDDGTRLHIPVGSTYGFRITDGERTRGMDEIELPAALEDRYTVSSCENRILIQPLSPPQTVTARHPFGLPFRR